MATPGATDDGEPDAQPPEVLRTSDTCWRSSDNWLVDLGFAGAVLDLGVNDLGRAEAFYATLIGRDPIFARSRTSANGVCISIPRWLSHHG